MSNNGKIEYKQEKTGTKKPNYCNTWKINQFMIYSNKNILCKGKIKYVRNRWKESKGISSKIW